VLFQQLLFPDDAVQHKSGGGFVGDAAADGAVAIGHGEGGHDPAPPVCTIGSVQMN